MSGLDSIVMTGASGLLGAAFCEQLSPWNPVCLGREDIALSSVCDRIKVLRPKLLIHCAADTDVEGAESAPDRVFAINALLPDLLAQACRASGARMVFFSSTGCYGDGKTTPYGDYDPIFPRTVHHMAKAAGEEAVRASGCDYLILRVGWLFGGRPGQRKNFVWQRIAEAQGKPEMGSDPNQFGTPTFVGDVVKQALRLVETGLTGTFNCVAGGAASRFDYVGRILYHAGLNTKLVPTRFARKAPVASNEAATNTKLDMLGLNIMPAWDSSLGRYVSILMSEVPLR